MVLDVKTATSFTRGFTFWGRQSGVQVSFASSLLADTQERKFATWGSLKPRCNFWHFAFQFKKSELALCMGVCLFGKVGFVLMRSESVSSVKTGLPSGLVALSWVGMEGLGRELEGGEQQDPISTSLAPTARSFDQCPSFSYVHKAVGANRLLINPSFSLKQHFSEDNTFFLVG